MRLPMHNRGAAGPLRYRLSELPERQEQEPPPGEAPGQAGRGVTDAEAGPDAALGLRAAALLGSLPRPAELSPAAAVRIRDRLGTLGAEGVPRPWWQWATAATAALGAATAAAILVPRPSGPALRPAAELVVRELRLPDSGVARLRTAPGSELMLGGPGALALPTGETPIPQLSAGRLAVRAGSADVVIDAAGRRVTIPKGHLAELVVQLGELVRVAAYVGDSSLLTHDQRLSVRQGTVWTRDGARPLAVECRGLVTAALDGGPWPSAAACSEATVAATKTVVMAPAPLTAPVAEREPVAAEPAAGPLRPAVRPASRVTRPSATAAPALVMPATPAVAAPLVGASAAAAHGTSGLAEESRLLGVVLHQLHQEHDGGAALRSLDSYQQRFPTGLLTEEAQAARIDALMLLDHRSAALALLDQTQFQRLGRGGELRVVRGELRATAGRCREALADFAAVLASTATPPPPVAERALYGQAGCFAQLTDTQRARASLEQYLARFPAGRFAEAARRSLQTLQ